MPVTPHPSPARSPAGRRPLRRHVTVVLALAGGLATEAPAQPLAQVAAARPAADASPARRVASDAQAAFERRRRAMLPVTRQAPGRCDVPIGRFCYWYDEHGPAGPPEPARIGEARRRLLATLDSAAAVDPADALVAGQRVRYLIESGALDEAADAAAACGAAAWWCSALRGWVHHAAGRTALAESAFDSALATMPDEERCRWSDVSDLLDGDARSRYRRLGCEERAGVERRFWWLATPFFSRGGNDRRNEHLARRTLARLASESPTAYQTRWSDDLEEVLLRYGWAERWSRRDPPPGSPALSASVVGHEPSPAYRWTADASLLEDPYPGGTAGWKPRDPAARERVASPQVRHLVELRPEVATFRRGDSLLVLAWFERPDTLHLRLAPALLVVAREGEEPTVLPFGDDGGGRVATALTAAAPHLVGVEMPGDSGFVAWGRLTVAPEATEPGALALSDVLPHAPAGDVAPDLHDVAPLALADATVRAGEPLAVYWEVYGLADGRHEQVETSISVVGGRPGLVQRAWRRLRGRDPAAPVHVRWTDRLAALDGRASRSVTVGVLQLEPGAYTLVLTVRSADGRSATEARPIRVVR